MTKGRTRSYDSRGPHLDNKLQVNDSQYMNQNQCQNRRGAIDRPNGRTGASYIGTARNLLWSSYYNNYKIL